MQITLVISCLYGGGAERVTCNLANYLANEGHHVNIITISETKESYPLDSRIEVTNLHKLGETKIKPLALIIRLHRILNYLMKNKSVERYVVMLPDVITTFMKFSSFVKGKIILSERGDPSRYSPKTQEKLLKCASNADGFVFQTDEVSQWYVEKCKIKNYRIIPNAINPEFLSERPKCERKNEIIGIGRLNHQKNFKMLIDAFARVYRELDDYSLTIYGEGNLRSELEMLIKQYGLESRVKLPGNTSKIIEKIEMARIFVLSSEYEGMPNALMEAMALGTACIATDCPVGGPRYLIDNGKNGLLIPTSDCDALCEALIKLANNHVLEAEIGQNAKKIKRKLSPDVVYKEWEKYILDI